MRLRQLTVVVLVFVLAGCVALPFDQPINQEQPVQFIANNSAETPYTFEVFVVKRPANVTFQRSDGKSGTLDIGQGVGTTNPGGNRTYTEVEVPDTARSHEQLDVAPGESKRSSVESLPRNFALVVTVSQDENQIVGFVTANCDDLALAKLRVTRNSEPLTSSVRVSTTHSCV